MAKSAQEAGKELIERLLKGKMDSHPAVKFHIKRALSTGDYATLITFLDAHPILLAFSDSNEGIEAFQKASNAFRPYPSREKATTDLSGPLKLGYVNEFDDKFGVTPDVLCMFAMVLGRPGSGKSQLNKYLLCQILNKIQNFNVIIFDLKPEYHVLLPYARHLKVLTPAILRINPLQVPDWMTPQENLIFFSKVFTSENWLAGTSENLLLQMVAELYRQRGIFENNKNYPTLQDLYDEISKRLSRQDSYRYRDVLLWLQNRLYPYTQSQIFQCNIGLADALWRTENVVLRMDTEFTNNMYCFTVSHIAGLLYNYNRKKGLRGAILRTLINVDEARILFNAYRDKSDFGESYISDIVTKTRDFGIGFIISSQESSSFNDIVRSNSYTKIAFPLQEGKDVKFVQESFGLTDEQTQHIFKLPSYGQAIVRYGGYPDPFILEVPFFKIKKQITDEEIETRMSGWYEGLRSQIKEVEKTKPVDVKTVIRPDASSMLYFLSKNPFAKKTEMEAAPGFKSPADVTRALEWLEKNHFINLESYRATKRGRKSTFAVLTDKAYAHLGTTGPRGKGSFEHSLYQFLIFKSLTKENMASKIEGRMKGSNKFIDVLSVSKELGVVAYEITLHFENLVSNIHQDLADGVSRVVIVTRDQQSLGRAKKIVKDDQSITQHSQKISFETIDYFFS